MASPRITTVEELQRYLYAAMQLEHATIPPYLTALYSIHPGTNSDAFHVPTEFRDTARALAADPLRWLLAGGEDHALAATFPPDVDLPMAWSVVGRAEAGEGVLVDGAEWAGPGGWRSF